MISVDDIKNQFEQEMRKIDLGDRLSKSSYGNYSDPCITVAYIAFTRGIVYSTQLNASVREAHVFIKSLME